MLFKELFYQTQHGEIFLKSGCMRQEHVLANYFSKVLRNSGYQTTDPLKRIWVRHNNTVVVCLTDDFSICGANLSKPPGRWFDCNTTVITDNLINYCADYNVIRLPASYFGVFSYCPALQKFEPTHRFHLSVNRLDPIRQVILFELVAQSGGFDMLQQDLINFNARVTPVPNGAAQGVRRNFVKHWQLLAEHYTGLYDQYWDAVVDAMPIRNHALTIEQAGLNAYLNLVIETYSGNTTITFSEKTFRALVTPAPWAVFAATGAVRYLIELGFDVMSDIVDHSYDQYVQDAWPGNSKIVNYISVSMVNYQRLKQLDPTILAARCKQAALHNQQVLATMKKQWPADFAKWLPDVIAQIT